MKIVTYNINGLRASEKLGLLHWIKDYNADVVCIQEVRCNEELAKSIILGSNNQIDLFSEKTENKLNEYYPVFNCGKKAGYAGTLTLTKEKPQKVIYDMQEFWSDDEGRTTTIILNNIAIINTYVPNGNSRLEFKMKYLDALIKFINKLKQSYSVICVGDFNIAHNEIDLTHPKECKNKSVFLPIERKAFSDLLNIGMVDTFRYIYPTTIKYSWRSYRSRQDINHNGWKYRIDYILSSNDLVNKIKYSDILDLEYSDHLPVVTDIE